MKRSFRPFFVGITALIAAAAPGCARQAAAPEATSLRALDAAYVEAWLEDDVQRQESAVLDLFARDAVIMPGGGAAPSSGIDSLRNFWFPDGAPPTSVTHFSHDIDEVELSGDLGVISGRYALSFLYDGRSVAQAGNYLIVAKNGPRGWKIKRMIWNDQPLTEV